MLIEVMQRILVASRSNPQAILSASEALADLTATLLEGIDIDCWLGYRAVTVLSQSLPYLIARSTRSGSDERPQRARRRELIETIAGRAVFARLWSSLIPYLPQQSAHQPGGFVDLIANPRRFSPYGVKLVPDSIRVEDGGKLIPIATLLADAVKRAAPPSLNWLTNQRYTTDLIRPLADALQTDIELLLTTVQDIRFFPFVPSKPLPTSSVQKILKVVRNTDDQRLLAGALVALSTSKYLRMAGSQMILKLLRTSVATSPFGLNTFSTFQYARYSAYSEAGSEESSEIAMILKEVAEAILNAPTEYPFLVSQTAAEYLSENLPVGTGPLYAEAARLKIELLT